jgi:hypothetical protein
VAADLDLGRVTKIIAAPFPDVYQMAARGFGATRGLQNLHRAGLEKHTMVLFITT